MIHPPYERIEVPKRSLHDFTSHWNGHKLACIPAAVLLRDNERVREFYNGLIGAGIVPPTNIDLALEHSVSFTVGRLTVELVLGSTAKRSRRIEILKSCGDSESIL